MSIVSRVGRHLPSSIQPLVRRYRYQRLVRNWSPELDALACRRYIQCGANVIDVGANIGCYTKVLSEYVGPLGTVHAVEPLRETFGYLLNNVESLGLTNVFLYNAAASDRCGFSRLTVPEWDGGGRNLYEARLSESGNLPVRLISLDATFYDLKPSFIKSDTEGHDIEVIRGAHRIISTYKPVWLMEVTHPDVVVPLMESYGYKAISGEHSFFFLSI